MLGATVLLHGVTRRIFDRQSAAFATALFAGLGSAQFLGAFATYDAMALFLLATAVWMGVRAASCLTMGARSLLLLAATALVAAGVHEICGRPVRSCGAHRHRVLPLAGPGAPGWPGRWRAGGRWYRSRSGNTARLGREALHQWHRVHHLVEDARKLANFRHSLRERRLGRCRGGTRRYRRYRCRLHPAGRHDEGTVVDARGGGLSGTR